MTELQLSETTVERQIGGQTLTLKTGMMAKQAAAAVVVQYGQTVVLSAVSTGKPRPGIDFFPLMVDYREKMYAAGKFPGGFFKREARPSDNETLVMRLTDRPLRPLFPEGFKDEVVINSVVLSFDGENEADVLSLTGAGAAVTLSPLPFAGPVAGVRVGRVGGELVVNPTVDQRRESDIDLVVAGTQEAVTMVEAGADEIPEQDMLDAIACGHEAIREICEAISELREQAGKPKMDFTPADHNQALQALKDRALAPLKEALLTPTKFARRDAVKAVRDEVVAELARPEEEGGPTEELLKDLWEKVMEAAVREMLLAEKKRVDGRTPEDVRAIDSRVAMLPCAHGSALFTRGETQALVSVTLGTKADEQTVEGLKERRGQRFYLHYNFPGFCVGEAKMPRGPGRREIGHGTLAQRALTPVMPPEENFPYTVRVVSDIMESNGSSSMASVCGGTLALMDAGVPIQRPVAGIAMGLIKESDQVVVLSDILGDEDHYGDMDFKVTGTQNGVTALQMDIKCAGLSTEILQAALEQARQGRLHILREMLKAIQRPREEISPLAPRIHTLQIPVDGIGKLIGPGGKTIRALQDEHDVKIDVEDDGTVTIASADGEALEAVLNTVEAMFKEPEIGAVYEGEVKTVRDFGCFVEIAPGVDGLVHVSELDHGFVKNVSDVANVGDQMRVKILDIDDQGRIRLSRKAILPKPEGEEEETKGGKKE
jgi:polyribonucleotide nucleotidyltransferase